MTTTTELLHNGMGTSIELPAGFVLVREGTSARQAFVIERGVAAVTRDGEELGLVGEGAVVGELGLLDGRPRSATVTAVSSLRVLVLDPRELASLMAQSPQTRARLAGIAAAHRQGEIGPTLVEPANTFAAARRQQPRFRKSRA